MQTLRKNAKCRKESPILCYQFKIKFVSLACRLAGRLGGQPCFANADVGCNTNKPVSNYYQIMLLKIVGIICCASIILKNIIQHFLYSYSAPVDKEGNSYTPFRLSIFLPYLEKVPSKLKKVKLICNICFYIFILSAILCALIWGFYRN